jgi:hypothetical protein
MRSKRKLLRAKNSVEEGYADVDGQCGADGRQSGKKSWKSREYEKQNEAGTKGCYAGAQTIIGYTSKIKAETMV